MFVTKVESPIDADVASLECWLCRCVFSVDKPLSEHRVTTQPESRLLIKCPMNNVSKRMKLILMYAFISGWRNRVLI